MGRKRGEREARLECPWCRRRVRGGEVCGGCGVGYPRGSAGAARAWQDRSWRGRARRGAEEAGPAWENGVRELER